MAVGVGRGDALGGALGDAAAAASDGPAGAGAEARVDGCAVGATG
jgi:hypothetical protein